jgi:hypothetical protein
MREGGRVAFFGEYFVEDTEMGAVRIVVYAKGRSPDLSEAAEDGIIESAWWRSYRR